MPDTVERVGGEASFVEEGEIFGGEANTSDVVETRAEATDAKATCTILEPNPVLSSGRRRKVTADNAADAMAVNMLEDPTPSRPDTVVESPLDASRDRERRQ